MIRHVRKLIKAVPVAALRCYLVDSKGGEKDPGFESLSLRHKKSKDIQENPTKELKTE
jgi:hypothetical protein